MTKLNKLKEASLTQQRLVEVLSYNLETGIFTWVKKTHPRATNIKIGLTAGALSKSTGYVVIGIDGKQFKAHRLVWLYIYGDFPQGEENIYIDHINGRREDNRLINLRISSQTANNKNKLIHSNNTSGVTGVCRISSRNGNNTKKNYYWSATWQDENGKAQVKNFSVLSLGEETAKQMAIGYRVEQI